MTRSHRAPRTGEPLRAPLKHALDASLGEADIQRMWRELQRAPGERARALRVGWRAALAGAVLACALLGSWRWLTTPARPAGPLALVGANATQSGLGPAQVFGGDAPTRLALDDGSRVTLARAARLEVLENSGRSFATRLRGGRGEFAVEPGGARRWSIECGLVVVEVVGTRFAIDRDERGVRVEVAHGVVRVRGPGLPGGVRRLRAGDALYVPAATPPAVAATDAAQAPSPAAAAAAAAPSAPAHDEGARDAAYERATAVPAARTSAARAPVATAGTSPARAAPGGASAGADALECSARTAERCLRRADDARRRGEAEAAARLLERVAERARGTPHAALAALTLARLRIADQPERVAAVLSAVAATRVPRGLREDILARRVEAHARAGQPERARQAAAEYEHAYPHGERRDEVRRWAPAP